MMTEPLSSTKERISLEDLALAHYLIDEILEETNCKTYEFYITSDTLTDSEETG